MASLRGHTSNTYAASVALVHDHLDFVSTEDRRKLLRTTAENTFFFAGKK